MGESTLDAHTCPPEPGHVPGFSFLPLEDLVPCAWSERPGLLSAVAAPKAPGAGHGFAH